MNQDSAYLYEDIRPDIPRKAYFPSAVTGMPRAFFGQGIGSQTNTYVSNTPFHEEQMRDARKRVMDRFRINGYNNNNYLIGGVRNMLPKPQPQGSFAMPLNTSGNQTYPTAGFIRGGGGSFRTDAGAAYGQQLLRQRADQLRQLQAVVEQGAAVPSVPAPAPAERMDAEDADEIAFTLLLDDLDSAVTSSAAQYGASRGVSTRDMILGGTTIDDFRRLFGLARKIVIDLPRNKLIEYITRLEDLTDTYATAIQNSQSEANAFVLDAAMRRILPLYKTAEVLRMGVATLTLQEKPRRVAMRQFIKEIAGAKSVKALDDRVDRMVRRIQMRRRPDEETDDEANEQDEEDEEAEGIGAAEAGEDEQVAAGMAVVAPPEEEEAGEQDEILRQLDALEDTIDYLFTDFQGNISNQARKALSSLGRLVNGLKSNPARINNRTTGLMGSLSETLTELANEEDDNTLELELRTVAQMADNLAQLMSDSLQGSGYGKRVYGGVSTPEPHKKGKGKAKAKGKKRGGAMSELDMKIEQVGKMNDKARKTHQQDLAYGKGGRVTTKSYSSERTNTGMNNQRFSKQKGSNVSMVITQ
jgi:hypothetical protein